MRWDPLLRRLGYEWKPIPEILEQLADAPLLHDGYHRFVFQWDESFYRERVEMAGFTGAKRVLDAGCGHGQWSVALSRCNEEVTAVDRHPAMCETAELLCERWKAPNVRVLSAQLPDLPFPDEHFDSVWCALTLEYADREATMAAFARVLKPGGRLYVVTNSRGRWLFKLLKAIFEGSANRARNAWRTLRRGYRAGARPNYTSMRDVPGLCERHGFEVVATAPDGCLDLSGHQPPRQRPMFAKHFLFCSRTTSSSWHAGDEASSRRGHLTGAQAAHPPGAQLERKQRGYRGGALAGDGPPGPGQSSIRADGRRLRRPARGFARAPPPAVR